MKVVINACFGGYGLSEDAIRLYAEKKGLDFFVVTDKYGFKRYYTVEPAVAERTLEVAQDRSISEDERDRAWNEYKQYRLDDYSIARNDPTLVEVVEELGSQIASDRYAELKIVEVPDDVEWDIDDYDGRETVEEVHRSWC